VFDVSLSYGFNTETTFQDFQTYPAGAPISRLRRRNPRPSERHSHGSEGRSREHFHRRLHPAGAPDLRPLLRERLGARLSASAAPNQSYSVVWGDSTEKLGAVVSFAYNYKNQNQTEEQNFYSVSDEAISLQNAYDFDVSGTDTTMGLVGNLAYKIDGSNRIAFENFYTNNSSNETRVFQGFNQDINTEIVDSVCSGSKKSIYSGKVSGEHFFSSLSNRVRRGAALFDRGSGRARHEGDALRATCDRRVRAGRRVPERLPDVQRPERPRLRSARLELLPRSGAASRR
jgi:hypothetical protein